MSDATSFTAAEHASIRSAFPGADKAPYFDVAARGLISNAVHRAVASYMDHRMAGGADKASLWATVDDARGRFARLVNADEDEIAIIKNVSEGLNAFANSLDWAPGQNVVVCPAVEHPNNVFLWYNLRDRWGIEVREVEPQDGVLPVDRMAAAMDEHTRLVTMPSMSFAPGFITDVAGIAAAARDHGALTLVDGAQSVGALATDVRALGIDALAVATQKCLLSLYGLGFLYVRSDVADHIRPASVGRYGVDLGDAHETALSEGPLRFQPAARRFDLSNHNYLGATAAAASLEMLGELGVPRIEAHVRRLAAQLAEGLGALNLPVAGGSPGPHLGHIVAVGESGGGRHDTADDPRMNALYAHLAGHGVRLSIRNGTLRFSVGLYNDDDDVDRVVTLTREWQEASPAT